jgi:hypothetical protein
VCPYRTRLLRRNEPRTDPDSLRAVDEVRCQTSTVVHCTCTDDPYRLASQWGSATFDRVDDGGDKDGGGDIARVAASFPCLRTDEVDADVESFLDMLGMADHLREEITMSASRVKEK